MGEARRSGNDETGRLGDGATSCLGDGATSRRPFSSAGLARATASATAAVKRRTDAWPKKSCPVHQAGKVKESRKLGADSPVQLLRLRL